MKNIICLQEFKIKKQLNKAYKDLTDVRLLISYGEHEKVEDARKIEKQIVDLESKLEKLIETDLF
jgi:hypothetical protein